MKNIFIVLFVVIVSAVGMESFSDTNTTKSSNGVLSPLQVGSEVSLKEDAGGAKITVFTPQIGTHKIVEVGKDFVVLVDIAGIAETRIPVYNLKSIVIMRK